MLTIDNATKIFQKKQKVNKLTAEIIKLRAELAHWEKQRDFEAHKRLMVGRKQAK